MRSSVQKRDEPHQDARSAEWAPNPVNMQSQLPDFLLFGARSLKSQLDKINQLSSDIRNLRNEHRQLSAQKRKDETAYRHAQTQDGSSDPELQEEQIRLRHVWETSQQREYDAEQWILSRQRIVDSRHENMAVEVVELVERLLPGEEHTTSPAAVAPSERPPTPSQMAPGPQEQPISERPTNRFREAPVVDLEPDGSLNTGVTPPTLSELGYDRTSAAVNRPTAAGQKLSAAKRQILNMYETLQEFRDSYDEQVRIEERLAREEHDPDWDLRFDLNFLLSIRRRTQEIIAAEKAWSETASEARRAGVTRWGAAQSSRFSQMSSDRLSARSGPIWERPDDCGWLEDWAQDQLDCFSGNPPIEEDFDEWRVPPTEVEHVPPAFDKDNRLWRQPEGFPGLPLLQVDEGPDDCASGRRRRHIEKWNVLSARAWDSSVQQHQVARALDRSRKALQAARAPENPEVRRVGGSDIDQQPEPDAEVIRFEEPTIVNLVDDGETFQDWHTRMMVDRYHNEDADIAGVQSRPLDNEDQYGEIYWTQPRVWGRSIKRLKIARPPTTTVRAPEVDLREIREESPPGLTRRALRKDRPQLRAFDISRKFKSQGGV